VGIECSADLWLALDLRYPAKEILGDSQPLRPSVLGDGGVEIRRHVSDLQGGGHVGQYSMRNACTLCPRCHRPGPPNPTTSILMFEPRGTSTTGDQHEGAIPDHVDSTTGRDLG
jgi:hypothetical protein